MPVLSVALKDLGGRLVTVTVQDNNKPGSLLIEGIRPVLANELIWRMRAALNPGEDRGWTVTVECPEGHYIGDWIALPVLVALLRHGGRLPEQPNSRLVYFGSFHHEPTLDRLPIQSCAGAAVAGAIAAREKADAVVCHYNSIPEVTLAGGVAFPVYTVGDLMDILTTGNGMSLRFPFSLDRVSPGNDLDRALDKPGLAEAREAIAKAAGAVSRGEQAGVMLIGPPGCGKTLLARWAVGLVTTSEKHRHESLLMRSLAGLAVPVKHGCFDTTPPLRAPHPTASEGALVGHHSGAGAYRPADHIGEVNLAHGGVLLLDEAAEFRRSAAEAVATAIRSGTSRYGLPCHALLIVASQACPCGHSGSSRAVCHCTEAQKKAYLDRLLVFDSLCQTVVHIRA